MLMVFFICRIGGDLGSLGPLVYATAGLHFLKARLSTSVTSHYFQWTRSLIGQTNGRIEGQNTYCGLSVWPYNKIIISALEI